MSDTLNLLEERYPYKFNKETVYATISDHDSMGKTEPGEDSAIFTTYDSSKGLERKICVAASRGKDRVIFVKKEILYEGDTKQLDRPENIVFSLA